MAGLDRIEALRRTLEGAGLGGAALHEYGQWISARTSPEGRLVQINANGTFHVDGEFAGEIPDELRERAALLIAELEEEQQDEEELDELAGAG